MGEGPVHEQLFEGRRARPVASNRAAGAALLIGLVMGATITALLPARARRAVVTVSASCSIDLDGAASLATQITFSSGHPSKSFHQEDPVIVRAVRASEAWEPSLRRTDPTTLSADLSAEQMVLVRRWLDGDARVASWTARRATSAREASLVVEDRYRASTEQDVMVDVLLIDVDDAVETANTRTSCPAGQPRPSDDIRMLPS